MEAESFAALCKALSDPTRVRILGYLLACGGTVGVSEDGQVTRGGASAGEVCCQITGKGGIDSRISFHLHKLRRAGLLTIERNGRRMVCTPNREVLDRFSTHFQQLPSDDSNCS